MNSYWVNFHWNPLRRNLCCLDTGAAPAGGGSAPASATPSGGSSSPAPAALAAPGSGSSGGSPGAGEGSQGTPSETPPAGDSQDFDSLFGGLDDDFDQIDLGAEATGTDPGAAAPPAGEASPVVPPAAAQGAQPPQPPAGEQPPAAPAPAGNERSTARSPLENAIEGMKTSNKELSQWASENLFALSAEDVEALNTDAEKVIPQIAGRVYTQALTAAANLIQNFVPQMVAQGLQQHSTSTARATEALSQFYAANPHLNAAQHGQAVEKWARSFRAANPKASRADAIAFVGRAVAAELGIQPGAAGTAPAGNGHAPVRPAPFAPARPGARLPEPPPQDDPYGGLDQDFD